MSELRRPWLQFLRTRSMQPVQPVEVTLPLLQLSRSRLGPACQTAHQSPAGALPTVLAKRLERAAGSRLCPCGEELLSNGLLADRHNPTRLLLPGSAVLASQPEHDTCRAVAGQLASARMPGEPVWIRCLRPAGVRAWEWGRSSSTADSEGRRVGRSAARTKGSG